MSAVLSAPCVHGWSYAGPAPAVLAGAEGCERPVLLGCRCGVTVTVDCHSSRSRTCGPCGLAYRDRVRRLARVPAGGVLLVTLTAPGRRGHKRNVGGERVQQLRDGKRHTTWRGGRPVDCDCWRALDGGTPAELLEHAARVRAALPRWATAGGAPRASVLPVAARLAPDRPALGGMDRWNASLGVRWNRFMTHGVRRDPALAWAAGAYFKATEPQARGALHVHALVRVPAGFDLTSAMVDALAAEAERHGFGHVADVQAVEAHRAAGYVAKYVAKGADDRPEVPWRRLKSRPGGQSTRQVLPDAVRETWAVVLPPEDRPGAPALPLIWWVSRRATYRTWSASRDWPHSMRALREAQEHYAALMAVRPRMVEGDGVEVWSWWADLAPWRPDLPWDPGTGEIRAGAQGLLGT